MEKPQTVPFGLQKITTEQFAILGKIEINDNDNINLDSTIGYFGSLDNRIISVASRFEFDLKGQKFLIIEVVCHFVIEEKAWKEMFNKDENKLILPKGFATHLAVLSVGTTRGVLHAKTENTPYNQYPLPSINLTKMIKEDIVVNF